MTLRRKGKRTILVDGVAYRWTVAPNDEPGLGIVVECAEAPAQRLVSWVDHGTIISPRLVRAAIVDGDVELDAATLDRLVDAGPGRVFFCNSGA